MKFLKSNKGIALITSLMITLISLTIIMALLYMVTQSTRVSASLKAYKSSMEASHGGSELFTKDILPYLLLNFNSASLATDVATAFNSTNNIGLIMVSPLACMQAKLRTPSSLWPAGCSNSPSPKESPDITFNLSSGTANPYIVYSKIVETIVGNTDNSGLQLEGSGVSEATAGITPQHFPYLYRLEIQGERATASVSQANIEVLYAY